MNGKKAIFIFVLIIGVAVGYPFFRNTILPLTQEAQAQSQRSGVQIILDGKLMNLEAAPVLINGRTLTPLRTIAERMGATVGWDGDLKRISVYCGDKYVILYVDNPQMLCGTFGADVNGQFNYLTRLTYTLDAAPTTLDGVTVAPIRAVAESLGASVSWEAGSQTVYINSPFPDPASSQQPAPDQSPLPAYTEMHFQEISAAQAQEWFSKSASFMLYYYSSLDPNSNAVLSWVLAAAKEQGLKVYGVDKDSAKYDNTTGALTFIWDYLDKASANNTPSLLFIVSPQKVTPLIQPKSSQSVEFCMTAFYYNAIYSSKTPSPGSGAPSPTSAASVDVSRYWHEISINEAISKHLNNDKFVFICYNSLDPTSTALMPMIQLAVFRTRVDVYAYDFANREETRSWFGYEALNGRQIYAFPTLFFVYNSNDIPYASVQPGDIQVVMDALSNFTQQA
ncbi:MAG: copper amine oxidase N-terminal domain-containing protein [Clostridiales bacterium]|nr:copper amine oxidase N-terminal domain-containing protein [Clostridiales bacterium]